MFSSLYLTILAAFLAARSVTATGQFIGCCSSLGTDLMPVVTSDPYNSCDVQCHGFKYSFTLTPTHPSDSVDCSCSNTLSSLAIDYFPSSGGLCSSGDTTIREIISEYVYQSCYDISTIDTTSYTVNQPHECFAVCKSTLMSYTFTSQQSTGDWDCHCSKISPLAEHLKSSCSLLTTFASYFFDFHPASTPQPSGDGMRRRSLKDKLAKRRKEMVYDLCPRGMVACKVGSMEAYECLDVSTELESCGNCMYGVFGSSRAPLAREKGIDCSILPGIPLGAVTCSSGQCVASTCMKGWVKQGDKCVRVVEEVTADGIKRV